MIAPLSENAQAVLLLTSPLGAGRRGAAADLLAPREYNALARHLHSLGAYPSDLLGRGAATLIDECGACVDKARLEALLGRGLQLSAALERWGARAIWVLSRADEQYPSRLMVRLGDRSPVLLYGCGDASLLETGGLAVVGSRHVDPNLIEYTEEIGQLAAGARRTIVSGGARGIDQAAMRGALEAGGRVVGVLADSLERASIHRDHRRALMEGELVLVSPFDPGAGFNVGNAMQRNKYIYALADAALVVSADVGKGGTWSGAVEQLDRLRLVPVYVRSTGAKSAGLDALREKGAAPWPNPKSGDELDSVLDTPAESRSPAADQGELGFVRDGGADDSGAESSMLVDAATDSTGKRPSSSDRAAVADGLVRPPAAEMDDGRVAEAPVSSIPTPADEILDAVRRAIIGIAQESTRPVEVANSLGVRPGQASAWLKQLAEAGDLERSDNPVLYKVAQPGLFRDPSASSAMPHRGAEAGEYDRAGSGSPDKLVCQAVRRAIERVLAEPGSMDEVRRQLDVSAAQAKDWVQALVDAGAVARRKGRLVWVGERGV